MTIIPRSKMPNVLITGGAGFIGSHLAEALLERGHHVTVIDDLSTGRFENIIHLIGHPRFRYAIDSITNEVVLDRLASECRVIFHLAAAVGVKLIVKSPVHTIETNVNGTEAVLKAALRYRAKILVASTSEVYGKGNSIPFREDDDVVLGPTCRHRWAYAASKMVDEFLALAYHREKGLPVVIFRLFNTVGPRQTGRYGMVIPRFVRQALRNEPLTVYGDGQQSRCFCDVQDAVNAIIALSECPVAVGQVFNVGSIEEVTILALAQKVLTLVDGEPDNKEMENRKSKIEMSVPFDTSNPQSQRCPGSNHNRSHGRRATNNGHIIFIPYEQAYEQGFEDMRRRVPDILKIRRCTGWEPRISLDETLRTIVESSRLQGREQPDGQRRELSLESREWSVERWT